MAHLIKTSSRFLGEQLDFERESYLEGFIFSNTLILAATADAPENLIPVYVIGRQEICKLSERRHGITDLTCLIWEPDFGRYEIWIYELKVYSSNISDVIQLTDYLKGIESLEHRGYRDDIVLRAVNMVGSEFVDEHAKIRGALCAQAFSDEVMEKLIEENASRPPQDKLIAVKVYRFPVDDEVFVFVERVIGEEKSSAGGHLTYYDDIPQMNEQELRSQLIVILSKRKDTHPQRFEQLKALLHMLTEDPRRAVVREELRREWEERGLPKEDRGLSVSQLLGYKNNGALRQILSWDRIPPDTKDNYRLRDVRYAEVLREALRSL